MIPKKLLLICFLLFSACSIGQKPEEILTRWNQRAPIEKIYLHLDRENYLAGETCWFKAYLYSDYFPDTISTNLYAELLSDSNTIVSRQVLPVIAGNAYGQFSLPDSLRTGYYLVRAYTPTMLNQDPDFVYLRNLFIYGKTNKKIIAAATNRTRLEFFPEGGNFIRGLSNTIAFKASDENGLPVPARGVVKNQNNETVSRLESIHDGMGLFELTPAAGESFFAELDDQPGTRYPLPAPSDQGIALSIIPHPQGHFFELKQNSADPAFRASYMIGQIQHQVVFRYNFPAAASEQQGVINSLQLRSGILQVTIFNKDGMPLAERICFVNNKEYIQPAELVADSVSFAARGRNRFRIIFKDTIQGSLSVSVTDPGYEISGNRSENIYSRILLSSDLRGYIHNPAWYFRSEADSVVTALDLVMMTNGWRRFRWTALLKNGIPPSGYRDRGYVNLSGKVMLRGTRKPFAMRPMLVMISGPDKKRYTQLTATDKQGYFRIDSLIFFGKSGLLFSDIKGKKSEYIDVVLDADSLTRSFSLPSPVAGYLRTYSNQFASSRLALDYEVIQQAEGTLLENVTIKVSRKSPLEEVESRYTNGLFSGDASKTIDLVNNSEILPYDNIFDYLENRVNGLAVSRDGLDYTVYYRQMVTVSSLGNVPMTLYLDEIETDASFIAAIPADKIALVKVFSNFAGAAGNAPGGVLAIYTKKGDDYVNRHGFASYSIYQGYSAIREFYSPDYSVKKDETKADRRITLDWRPNIFLNHINPVIPVGFYNNDRTRRFRVVVEGITTSGKLICLEKFIE